MTPTAGAAFPGRNGAIAYVGTVDGVDNILTRTGQTVAGVAKGDLVASPAWSPLGRRLAFVRTMAQAGSDVWIAGSDGAGARQLTTGGDNVDPAWSPRGDEVAYAEGPKPGRHVFAIGADGNGLRQITFGAGDDHDPAWSVRDQLVYVRGGDLYVIAAHNGHPRRLTRMAGNETAPSWSPDGRRVAFTNARAVWTVSSSGGRPVRVILPAGGASSPAWSPDGRRILFSAGRRGQRRVFAVNPNGRALKALSSRRTDGRWPDWQSTGHDPQIIAAGDIACDPASPYFNGGVGVPRHCGQSRTANLLLRDDFWNVLVLGDTQYSNGDYGKFLQSYDPTWGRSKYLQRPTVGNHEYQTAANGYFDYFNGQGINDGPAGPRGYGYYSFDIGGWHVISLNSNCGKVPGGCEVGSPQEKWLDADLETHPARCTLAMWHSPLFSSFKGGDVSTIALWQTLYAHGADVVLVGHHHFYERMAPQTAGGDRDDLNGIRQFTVGTGGMSIDSPMATDPNSEVINETTFGVLKMVLHPDSYSWRFESASADRFTDVGTYPCH
jgi:dipeptidyl aminopeptidase/acylaminoacyl peptidase